MAIDIDKFVHDQLSVWPAVAAKYRALKSVETRQMVIGGILVTVPFFTPYAMGVAFLESRREWARAALERAGARNADLPEGEDIESLRAKAKAALPPRRKRWFRRELPFRPR